MKRNNRNRNVNRNRNFTNSFGTRAAVADEALYMQPTEAEINMQALVASDAHARIVRIDNAMPLAIIATVFNILSMPLMGVLYSLTHSDILAFLVAIAALVLSIMSYVRGSGLGEAISVVSRVAAWGWYLIPFFPIDVFVGFGMLMSGIGMLLFAPALVFLNAKRNAKKELKQARGFVQAYGQLS